MKKMTIFTMILLSVFLFTCCGDKATSNLIKELNSSYTYDGKEVELIGYLSPHRTSMVMNGKIKLGLFNSLTEQSGSELADVYIDFGKEPNNIYMPEEYKSSEIEFYDNTGTVRNYLTKFKIKGIVKYTKKDWEKQLTVPEDDPRKPAFAKEMTKKSVEKAKKAAEERKAKTGDANDYSFEINLLTITPE
jgi:hypothetical protein